jgi:hypothetical protein
MKDGIAATSAMIAVLVQVACFGEVTSMPWTTNQPIVSVRKELYEKHPKAECAPCLRESYIGPTLERWQIHAFESVSDVWHEVKERFSGDNGRTWSEYREIPNANRTIKGVLIQEGGGARLYDGQAGILLEAWVRVMRSGAFYNSFAYYHVSRDGGRSWTALKQLRYEEGEDFDLEDPLKPGYLKKNQGTPTDMIRHSNGTVLICAGHANAPDDPDNDERPEKAGALCFIGRWNAQVGDYDWVAGKRITGSPRITSRGMAEPVIAELQGGRVLMLLRGSDTPQTPGRRWFAVSADGGVTFGGIEELKYEDGSSFYTPSTMCGLIRHSVTGKLYYVGNISPTPPKGNSPRYPLIIAEVDEKIPALKRNTVTVVDTRRPEQAEGIQFSNFSLLENRETHELELLITLYGEHPGEHWATADCYKYWLSLAPR